MKTRIVILLVLIVALIATVVYVMQTEEGGAGSTGPGGSTGGSEETSGDGRGGTGGATGGGDDGKDNVPDDPVEQKQTDDASPSHDIPGQREHTIPGNPSVNTPEDAQDVVSGRKGDLGLGENDELEVRNSSDDGRGNTYYQLAQTYKGIPIHGARSLLEVENGRAVVISGTWQGDIELDTTPAYTAEEALRMALAALGATAMPEYHVIGEPELWIFLTTDGPRLAWQIGVNYIAPPRDPEAVVVDAHAPAILDRVPLMLE